MKRLFLFLTFLTVIFVSCSSKKVDKRIIGDWFSDTTLTDKKTRFTFKDNGVATVNIGNVVYEGEGTLLNGKTFKINYNIEGDKTPIELSIIANEQGGDRTKEVIANCIIHFISTTEIEMMANFEGQKFADFDPTDKAHYMRLIKK